MSTCCDPPCAVAGTPDGTSLKYTPLGPTFRITSLSPRTTNTPYMVLSVRFVTRTVTLKQEWRRMPPSPRPSKAVTLASIRLFLPWEATP